MCPRSVFPFCFAHPSMWVESGFVCMCCVGARERRENVRPLYRVFQLKVDTPLSTKGLCQIPVSEPTLNWPHTHSQPAQPCSRLWICVGPILHWSGEGVKKKWNRTKWNFWLHFQPEAGFHQRLSTLAQSQVNFRWDWMVYYLLWGHPAVWTSQLAIHGMTSQRRGMASQPTMTHPKPEANSRDADGWPATVDLP